MVSPFVRFKNDLNGENCHYQRQTESNLNNGSIHLKEDPVVTESTLTKHKLL